MGALGGAVSALFVGSMSLVFLRFSGGWRCLSKARRDPSHRCQGRGWADLTTLERAWFFGPPAFLTLALVCLAIALVTI